MHYTGRESAVNLDVKVVEPDSVFDLRCPTIPRDAVPIFDDDLRAVVGYCHESATGVYKIYDLEGKLIGMEEKGLETPVFDPLDLLFFMGGALRALGLKGASAAVKAAPRVAALAASRISARNLAAVVIGAMRAAFRGLSVRSLKFTATTAARMAAPGRYVPLHILHLGIKYGRRTADPQGVRGAFLYTAKMWRNGKEYILEIVVRESDWTILHFLYK